MTTLKIVQQGHCQDGYAVTVEGPDLGDFTSMEAFALATTTAEQAGFTTDVPMGHVGQDSVHAGRIVKRGRKHVMWTREFVFTLRKGGV